MQVPRPAVISKPLPEPKNLRFRSFGQSGQGRKSGQKPMKIGDNRGHLRLLQHQFADQHVICIRAAAGGSPRQIPTVLPVPIQQSAAELSGLAKHAWNLSKVAPHGKSGAFFKFSALQPLRNTFSVCYNAYAFKVGKLGCLVARFNGGMDFPR
jgi:hypothetical protein